LIESLRQDMERLRTERGQPSPAAAPSAPTAAVVAAAPPPAAKPPQPPQPADPAADAAAQAEAANKKKARRQKGSPVQDEWGFFDPQQCGFAALLAKLDEITENEDTPTPAT